MRALMFVAALTLAACVSAPGSGDTPPPFADGTSGEHHVAAPTGSYPIAVDLPAGVYHNDPHHSSVIWRIRHQGLAWLTGRFDTTTADLTLDPADPTHSSLQVTIEARSVDTNVLSGQGQRGFDNQVQGWIGATTTPQITFASTAIERTGQNEGRVTGNLTMSGQTHPVTLDVTYDGGHTDPLRGHTAIGFSAHTTIQRSQWGVNVLPEFAGDDVQLVIEMELVKT